MTKPIEVMLVDDEADFTKPVAFWLKSRGYSVTVAPEGKSALRMIEKNKPDIIFLDLRMPVMDGSKAIQLIKNDDALRRIPIIIITASAMDGEERATVKKQLASAYMKKPVTREQFTRELKRFLRYTVEKPVETRKPEKKANQPAGRITPEIKSRLPELLALLQIDLTRKYRKIKTTFIVNEIEDFSKEIIDLGNKYQIDLLKNWGDRLYYEIQSFDMEKLPLTLECFPGLVKEIASYND